jgi:anti-sigma factor RsiW
MFERPGGERVTLYIGSLDAAAGSGETAFRFATDGPVPSFYWIDRGFGYALAGALPRDALLGLATSVHRQLESTGG